jgi:hypothetical protein
VVQFQKKRSLLLRSRRQKSPELLAHDVQQIPPLPRLRIRKCHLPDFTENAETDNDLSIRWTAPYSLFPTVNAVENKQIFTKKTRFGSGPTFYD